MLDQTQVTRARILRSRLVLHNIGMTKIAALMKVSRQYTSAVLNDRIKNDGLLDRIEALLNDRERKMAA